MSFASGSGDVIDILLKLSGLQAFVAGAGEASASIKGIGTAAEESSAKSATMGSKMSGAAGLASKAFKGTAVAAGIFALQSVKMATSFEQNMELIHTQAGATQTEVTSMSKAILALSASGRYAQGPNQLAQGLYHLESIGLRGTAALKALKVAADGAAVGNANLEETTTALGSAWLVGIKGAGNLRQTMGLLNATVGAGNMRMNDLVESLGTGVLASAKLAGLGIQDVMGALATLTDEGYQGSSAMAQLATSFHFLTDPTKKAQDALHRIGLSTYGLSNIMRTQGLVPALKTLRDHLATLAPAQREAVLGDILPAGRGRVLEVLMNQVDRYGNKIRQISRTSGQFANDVAATHRTAAFRIHAAWSRIQADMIRVGNFLKPIGVAFAETFANMLPVLIKLAPYLAPLVAGFIAFRLAILGVRAAALLMAGVNFAATLITMTQAGYGFTEMMVELNLTMLANPFVLVATALVALGVAIFVLYHKVGWFRHAMDAAWSGIKVGVHAAISGIVAAFHWMENAATNVINFVKHHWRLLILVIGPLGLAIDFVTRHFKFFKTVATAVFHAIVSATRWTVNALSTIFGTVAKILSWPFKWAWDHVIKPIFNWIVSAARWMVTQVTHLINTVLGPIKSVTHFLGGAAHAAGGPLHAIGNFLGLAEGGTITSSGLAVVGEAGPEIVSLPRGAQVLPFSSPAAVGGNYTFVIPVQIDGREVVRATGRYVDNRLARQ